MAGVQITTVGPIFDGEAEVALAALATEIVSQVADAALSDLQARFHETFMAPTGAYESQVVKNLASPTSAEIGDGGSRYGPWLEGTSHRNQTTRFKGYHNFRFVTQTYQRQKAAAIATQILAYQMGRFGG
ncbi:hypothetical protein [Mycobacterium sp.]|uniref:hypothetical protein n=1 Tax=Mycobacterium sp. TaxID=1785 RepID=UPI002C490D9A|nr:hypothetical protein [Mycobacterium sp.]HTY35424.1 hypothetical protein [Mycobacterium sp.]